MQISHELRNRTPKRLPFCADYFTMGANIRLTLCHSSTRYIILACRYLRANVKHLDNRSFGHLNFSHAFFVQMVNFWRRPQRRDVVNAGMKRHPNCLLFEEVAHMRGDLFPGPR
jgi:hypothetical protein